ncbi:MAG: hypothetical protein NTY77_11540 [Elusimicrobia bacterium]|nr:hypothetical protein [Elusimicrobiota bacterium]
MSSEDPLVATTIRNRLIALGLGAAAALLLALAAEWACGILLRARGPIQWGPPAAAASGSAAESPYHIILPPPPSVMRMDQARAWSVDAGQIEDIRIPPDIGERIGPGLLWLPHRSFRFIRKTRSGRVIWDLSCGIDEFNRRDTPGERSKARTERFLLLLGDSFIFGEGVGQDETLAADLGRQLPWARVYNYGIGGLYPGELLERLRLVQGPPEIREPKGTALYFFADSHLLRNMGSLTSVGGWGYSRPYYHEDASGRIAAEQYIKDARPVWTVLAKLFVRSNVARFFNVDYPTRPREGDLRFMAKLVEQLRAETVRLGAERFYVVFYPNNSYLGGLLLPYLEKASIPVLDLSGWDLLQLTRGPAFIPGEGHPTAESHRLVADALARLLSSQRPGRRPPPRRGT